MGSLMNCTPHQILFELSKRMGWAGNAARMAERRGLYRVLVGKPEGKKPLERPRCRWEIILRWIFRSGMGGHGLD